MEVDIITGHPDYFDAPLAHSIIRKAQESGAVEIRVHNIRDYAEGRHKQIDDFPYGGGGGMVLKPEPIFACVEALREQHGAYDEIIYLTPDGTVLNQSIANEFSLAERLILLSGHYKGVDQRVRDELVTREISIGDFVLSGGELPILVVLDAVVRLVPGVLGDASSALFDSFQDNLLGAPVYTRPAEFRGHEVPEVLRSGDHERISRWREKKRIEKTRLRRPDLLPEEGDEEDEAGTEGT